MTIKQNLFYQIKKVRLNMKKLIQAFIALSFLFIANTATGGSPEAAEWRVDGVDAPPLVRLAAAELWEANEKERDATYKAHWGFRTVGDRECTMSRCCSATFCCCLCECCEEGSVQCWDGLAPLGWGCHTGVGTAEQRMYVN